MVKIEYQYRGHIITINDKIVECFTSFVDPIVNDSLFDMYMIGIDGNEDVAIEDIDFSQYSDQELSKIISSDMLDECKVTLEIKGYWDKEWPKIEKEENSQH